MGRTLFYDGNTACKHTYNLLFYNWPDISVLGVHSYMCCSYLDRIRNTLHSPCKQLRHTLLQLEIDSDFPDCKNRTQQIIWYFFCHRKYLTCFTRLTEENSEPSNGNDYDFHQHFSEFDNVTIMNDFL